MCFTIRTEINKYNRYIIRDFCVSMHAFRNHHTLQVDDKAPEYSTIMRMSIRRASEQYRRYSGASLLEMQAHLYLSCICDIRSHWNKESETHRSLFPIYNHPFLYLSFNLEINGKLLCRFLLAVDVKLAISEYKRGRFSSPKKVQFSLKQRAHIREAARPHGISLL